MLFFRSEEAIDRWCLANHLQRGESLSLDQLWQLSQTWYSNRLELEYHGRTIAQAETIFNQVGLVSPFWRGGIQDE